MKCMCTVHMWRNLNNMMIRLMKKNQKKKAKKILKILNYLIELNIFVVSIYGQTEREREKERKCRNIKIEVK